MLEKDLKVLHSSIEVFLHAFKGVFVVVTCFGHFSVQIL